MRRNTFREAAARRGLSADGSGRRNAIQEVAAYAPPKKLRDLVVYLLVSRDVGSPVDLRVLSRDELADGFRRAADRPRPTEERFFNESLVQIGSLVAAQGESTKNGFPMFPTTDFAAPHGQGGGSAGGVYRDLNE